jgi:ABC-type sugar transport system ATPase subunit
MLARPRILILDEVTAPLNVAEVHHVFALMKELKAQGIGIIFISHRLNEVVQMSDRIEVLRDGLNAGSLGGGQKPSEKAIIDLMLGSTVFSADAITQQPRESIVAGEAGGELVVQRLGRNGLFSNVSLAVNRGEIVGLAGLKGSGISDIMKTIFGAKPAESGQIMVDGKPLVASSPRDAISAGIGMITNDRQREGLALHRSIQENVTVCALRALRNSLLLTLPGRLAQAAAHYVSEVGAKHSSLAEEIINLSGGNQQKVLVAKWLLRDLQYLLVDEPTRGVDVKSQADIHRLLLQLIEIECPERQR